MSWFEERAKAFEHGMQKLRPVAGTVLGGLAGAGLAALTGGASIALGAFGGMMFGGQAQSSYQTAKANKQALELQEAALRQQEEEIARQRKIEIERQKRENQQLMNSISGLTNTAFSGVSSPTLDYDKYGDLG